MRSAIITLLALVTLAIATPTDFQPPTPVSPSPSTCTTADCIPGGGGLTEPALDSNGTYQLYQARRNID